MGAGLSFGVMKTFGNRGNDCATFWMSLNCSPLNV